MLFGGANRFQFLNSLQECIQSVINRIRIFSPDSRQKSENIFRGFSNYLTSGLLVSLVVEEVGRASLVLGVGEVLERHVGGTVPCNVSGRSNQTSCLETSVNVPKEVAALVKGVHISVAESES